MERQDWTTESKLVTPTVKAAMRKAKRSIILLGWDFDTRVELEKDPLDPKFPNRFGDFLERLVADNPRLEIHVLKWDF